MKTSLAYIFAILIMSMMVIFFNGWHFFGSIFMWLATLYRGVESLLHQLLWGGNAAHRFTSLLALVLIPIAFSGLLTLLLKLAKRYRPQFFELCALLSWLLLMIVLSVSGVH